MIPILWSTEALTALGAIAFWMLLQVVGAASQFRVEEEKIIIFPKTPIFSSSNRHKHSKRQSKALASLKELGYWLVKKV